MKKPEEEAGRDGLHLRAVLVPRSAVSFNAQSLFGAKLRERESLKPPADGWNSHVTVQAPFNNGRATLGKDGKSYSVPPSVLKVIRISNTRCTFEPIVTEIKIQQNDYVLLATPFVPVFHKWFTSPPLAFVRVDLRRVCDEQFAPNREARIKLVRVHFKLEGDKGERISSLTCIGKNVITSDVVRDVIGYNSKLSAAATPFSGDALAKKVIVRSLDPVSCRIKWDDGSDVGSGALNLDRYGNFSFYYKGIDTVSDLFPIFSYLLKINALTVTPVSPIEKSDEALKEVDAK